MSHSRRPNFGGSRNDATQKARDMQNSPTVQDQNGPTVQARALAILREFEQARKALVGRAVVLSDGKSGTVEDVRLDELHGLRVSIAGHDGEWPVSTVKLSKTD
jgi:hypothetical protein